MRLRNPCRRFRTRWLGLKVSLIGPLDCDKEGSLDCANAVDVGSRDEEGVSSRMGCVEPVRGVEKGVGLVRMFDRRENVLFKC